MEPNFITTNGGSGWSIISSTPSVQEVSKSKITILNKIKILGITIKRKITEISVDDFFNRVKKEKLKTKIIDKIFDKYLASIERAEISGQVALVEQLKDRLEIVKKETEMATLGISEYVEKKQIDELLAKTSKHIEITPIKNFTRHIPEDIIHKIKIVKSIFTDFVIVHYDPKKENIKMTKEEKRRKEDPVAFGIIKGSDRYYFIGDWIDEYCTLTIDEIVEITGKPVKDLLK